jgi:hypothetical protein
VSEDAGAAAEAYEAARSRHGMADVRPIYRQFLKLLKTRDSELYEAAVDRYETDVLGAGETADPLQAWIRYGAWLAGSLSPGRLVAIDSSGRAEKAAGLPPIGPLLLHLPEGTGERGLRVAVPEKPSAAQAAAQKLLCG